MVFFFQAEDGIRDHCVTGVQTCALPISVAPGRRRALERFPRGVHRLDTARSFRRNARMQGLLLPRSRAAPARHGARLRGEGKVSERLTSWGTPPAVLRSDQTRGRQPDAQLAVAPRIGRFYDMGMHVALML